MGSNKNYIDLKAGTGTYKDILAFEKGDVIIFEDGRIFRIEDNLKWNLQIKVKLVKGRKPKKLIDLTKQPLEQAFDAFHEVITEVPLTGKFDYRSLLEYKAKKLGKVGTLLYE